MVEQDTVCLLDFYVHESLQRRGIGFDLFNLALKVKLCEGDLRRSWAQILQERTAVDEICWTAKGRSPITMAIFQTLFAVRNGTDQFGRFILPHSFLGLRGGLPRTATCSSFSFVDGRPFQLARTVTFRDGDPKYALSKSVHARVPVSFQLFRFAQ